MDTEPRLLVTQLTIRVGLLAEAPQPYPTPIRGPKDIFELLRLDARSWDRERFVTVALDSTHRVLGLEEVSVGCLTNTVAHPREVFKALILANAAAFIAVHNHPSGDPTPSPEDVSTTRRLLEAGKLLGIPLLDHLVIGRDGFISLEETGALA